MMDRDFIISTSSSRWGTHRRLTSCEAEVDKIPQALRDREDELFKVCEKAWKNLPLHKILIAFEMRKDCARECTATSGDIDREGKDQGKAGKRVHEAPEYAALRTKLKLD